jgi:hypothetical protein
MIKAFASQPGDHGFELYLGHGHVSSCGTSTSWFLEADSKANNISCKNLFGNRAYTYMYVTAAVGP